MYTKFDREPPGHPLEEMWDVWAREEIKCTGMEHIRLAQVKPLADSTKGKIVPSRPIKFVGLLP
jgi:hypothetical protein